MDRPKTGPSIGLRIPDELLADVDAVAGRMGMTRSEWIKETIECRLKRIWAERADWYMLRGIDPHSPRLHGSTSPAIAALVDDYGAVAATTRSGVGA